MTFISIIVHLNYTMKVVKNASCFQYAKEDVMQIGYFMGTNLLVLLQNQLLRNWFKAYYEYIMKGGESDESD